MPNLKQIRNRIKSVKSTQQITRVMEMVSASKLARAQGLLQRARPYAEGMEALMDRVVASFQTGDDESPLPNLFLQPRAEVKRRCMVILTSDRGLCGSYNNYVVLEAERALGGDRDGWTLACIGKKGHGYFRKRDWNIGYQLTDTQGRIEPEQIDELSSYLTSGFESREFDEVHLSYTKFHSVGRYTPLTELFVPVEPVTSEEPGPNTDYIYEPDPKSVLDALAPDYLKAKLNITIYQTLCSEHSARMAAMRNATDNANEMIDSLTLQMNKARQAAITKEISEIVGGAEAIKG